MVTITVGSHGIVYVRVSTEHQASDELPIASQIAELTAAVERAGATCEVVQDAGISGTDVEGRHGLQSIAARAREPHPTFAWVLVWKFSRFARNMEEGLVYRALLRKRGIDTLNADRDALALYEPDGGQSVRQPLAHPGLPHPRPRPAPAPPLAEECIERNDSDGKIHRGALWAVKWRVRQRRLPGAAGGAQGFVLVA